MKTRNILPALACMLVLPAMPALSQLIIDFEPPTYTDGEINGQGVFVNSGGVSSGVFTVNSGVLDMVTGSGSSTTGFARVNPTSSELGVPDISNLTVPLSFSFDVTLPNLDDNSNILMNFELRAGASGFLSIQIRNDGRLRTSGVNFNNALTDTTSTISGLADFSTDTFDLFVDDVLIGDDIAFLAPVDGVTQFRLVKQNSANNDFSGLSLDNIVLEAIPEPTSTFLMASGLAGFLLLRRRR